MYEHLETSMLVYYSILLSMIVCYATYWNIGEKKISCVQNRSIFLDWRYWIPCLLFTFLLGFRWNFAYDWNQYYNTFNYIQHGKLYRDNTEVGYLAINYLLGHLGFNYYSIFILEAFLFYSSIFLLLKNNRKALLFGLCLAYIGMRFRMLNLSRQHFAMSIIWIAYYHLVNQRTKYFWIIALVACTIHSSAIIWTIPFFFFNKIRKFFNFKIALIIYFACYIFKTYVFDYLISLSDLVTMYIITEKSYTSEQMLSDTFNWGKITPWRMALNMVHGVTYIICMYYCLSKDYVKDKLDKNILYIGYIGLVLPIFGTSHEIVSRFMLYTTVFYYLGWGIFMSKLIINRNRVSRFIWILPVACILHTLYGMKEVINYEVSIGNFIQYKIGLF